MAASLPTIDITAITRQHETELKTFRQRAEDLRKRPLTSFTAALAMEADTAGKRFIEAAEAKRVELKKPILDAGRKIDEFFATMMQPAVELRALCTGVGVKRSDGGIVGRYNALQRRLAEERRLRDEAAALEAEKARRAAEVEHLATIAAETGDEAAMAEAERLEAEPLQVPVVPVEEPKAIEGYAAGKPKLVLKEIKDHRKVVEWLLESPGRFEPLFGQWYEAKEGGFNRWLARAEGIAVPGIETAEDYRGSNRSRA